MDAILTHWQWIATPVVLALSIGTAAHVVLHKRDTRSAIGWVGLIGFAPVVGSIFYLLFGINRIQRKALLLRRHHVPLKRPQSSVKTAVLGNSVAAVPENSTLAPLVRLVGEVTGQPLVPGNRVTLFRNGDTAYPEMLRAIGEARQSIALASYIFANDRAGNDFADALRGAVERGVEVRVLIDGIGLHYSWPRSILGPIRLGKVPVAEFLPALVPWRFKYANMRNHRKILVADGRIGFTGGMNIGEQNRLSSKPDQPVQDLHFRIEGPAVSMLQETFADDWLFSTVERLEGERWFPDLRECGPVAARGVSSGPDADLEKLRTIYFGALCCARERVKIVTPYFLPDSGLIDAINVAVERGVKVDLVIPEANNHRLVQWASAAPLTEILHRRCAVWQTPAPFDHSKLVLVDGLWTFLGSANWDARSLRLNFEFNLECYNADLTAELEAVVAEKIAAAKPLVLADLLRRNLALRLRDGVARLLTPYL